MGPLSALGVPACISVSNRLCPTSGVACESSRFHARFRVEVPALCRTIGVPLYLHTCR